MYACPHPSTENLPTGASSPGSLCPDVQGSSADVHFLNDLGLNIYAAGLYMCYRSSVNAPVSMLLHHIQNNRRAAALCSMLSTSWAGKILQVFIWVFMSCVVTAVSACFFVTEAAVLAASLISFVFVNLYLSAVGWACGWRESPAQAATQQPGQVKEKQQQQQRHKRDHNDLDTTTIPQQVKTAAKLQSASFINVDTAKETTSTPSTTGQVFVRLLAGRGLITVDLDQEDTYHSFVSKVRAKAGNNCLPPDGVFSFWTGKGRVEPSTWSTAACKGATLTVLMTLPGGVYVPELELTEDTIIWPDVKRLRLVAVFQKKYENVAFPVELNQFAHLDVLLLSSLSDPYAKAFQVWLRGLEAAYDPAPPLHRMPWSEMEKMTFKELRMSLEKWLEKINWKITTSDMGCFSYDVGGLGAAEQILNHAVEDQKTTKGQFWSEVQTLIRLAKAEADGKSE
jgi:hypothetical protein